MYTLYIYIYIYITHTQTHTHTSISIYLTYTYFLSTCPISIYIYFHVSVKFLYLNPNLCIHTQPTQPTQTHNTDISMPYTCFAPACAANILRIPVPHPTVAEKKAKPPEYTCAYVQPRGDGCNRGATEVPKNMHKHVHNKYKKISTSMSVLGTDMLAPRVQRFLVPGPSPRMHNTPPRTRARARAGGGGKCGGVGSGME